MIKNTTSGHLILSSLQEILAEHVCTVVIIIVTTSLHPLHTAHPRLHLCSYLLLDGGPDQVVLPGDVLQDGVGLHGERLVFKQARGIGYFQHYILHYFLANVYP